MKNPLKRRFGAADPPSGFQHGSGQWPRFGEGSGQLLAATDRHNTGTVQLVVCCRYSKNGRLIYSGTTRYNAL